MPAPSARPIFWRNFFEKRPKLGIWSQKSRIPKNGTLKCENERLYGVVYFRTHISMSNKLCFNNQPRNSLIINNKCQKNGCSPAKPKKERFQTWKKNTVCSPAKTAGFATKRLPSPTGPRAFAPTSTGPLPGTTLFPADLSSLFQPWGGGFLQ